MQRGTGSCLRLLTLTLLWVSVRGFPTTSRDRNSSASAPQVKAEPHGGDLQTLQELQQENLLQTLPSGPSLPRP
ncbi:hypothetical protein OYC64_008300 [Pagothenia borchgrevinki]|uniref:Uncharacterized protein n=2 Tax=Nototheniidae TaxID=8206 RepID=A0ABD2G4A0_PAGBO